MLTPEIVIQAIKDKWLKEFGSLQKELPVSGAYFITGFVDSALEDLPSPQSTVSGSLRNKYFKECVGDGKVNMAPHDLFEWFKKNVGVSGCRWDCSRHKKDLFGQTDMRVVAEAIGDLNYETLAELIGHLCEKVYQDAQKDKEGGRKLLSQELLIVSQKFDSAACGLQRVLGISRPFMNNKGGK